MKTPAGSSAWVSGLVAGLLLLAPGALLAEGPTRPPKDLKFIDDHWTPWTPPEVGADAYRIRKDDTLWHLAEGWLGDPYLWPQVWDENRYILDSHWIYPGDPLVVPGRPTVVPESGPLPVAEATRPPVPEAPRRPAASAPPVPAPPRAPAVAAQTAPVARLQPAAKPADLQCSGSIDPDHAAPVLTVAAGDEGGRISHGTGDVVFLSAGRDAGIAAGDEFTIVRALDEVRHPGSGESLGTYVRRLGKLRVLVSHAETSTAVVVMSCEDVRVGDELAPWVEIPIPAARPAAFDRYADAPSGGPTGRVVAAGDGLTKIAEGHILHTDLGQPSGVHPGDVLTLFRTRENGLPRIVLGQAVILTVEPGTSTAKVTLSTFEALIGDWVEVAAR